MQRNSLFRADNASNPKNSDFKQLVLSGRTIIDNSKFIQESLEDGSYVKVFKFPPGSGKSTLLSMLRYFFASSVDGIGTKALFNNLEIQGHPKQGTKSVIYLDLSQMDINAFEDMEAFLTYFSEKVKPLYQQYNHVLPNDGRNQTESKGYARLLDICNSVHTLARYIKSYNSKHGMGYSESKPIILIDAPCIPKELKNKIQEEIAGFMQSFYQRTCKDTDDKISAIYIMRHINDHAMYSNNCSHHKMSDKYPDRYEKFFAVVLEHNEQNIKNPAIRHK